MRTRAAAVLATVVLLLAFVVPAGTATAAGTTLSVSSPTPKYQPRKTLTVKAALRKGDTVTVQRLSGKKWVKASSRALSKAARSTTATYTFPREAAATFRAVLTRRSKTVGVSATRTYRYQRLATDAGTFSANGRLFGDIGGRIAAGEKTTETVVVLGQKGRRTVYLQEYRRGKWVNLQRATTQTTGYGTVRFTSPMTTPTVTRTYRFHVAGTRYEKPFSSRPTTLRHMNPRDYRGAVRTAYTYLKAYCPRQVITLARDPQQDTSFASWPSLQIEMAPTLTPGKTMQYVSLHECAHIRTFKVYGNGIDAGEKRLDKIYGRGNGVEMVADCMSYLMGADKRFGGAYTTSCSGARGAAAKRILSGKKA